jgi:type I restriction enzyme M protein
MTGRSAIFKRSDAEKAVVEACKTHGITLTPWMGKTLWACIEHRDPNGEVQMKGKRKPEPDAELRDTENVPLSEDVDAYFKREVLPHASDAWIDSSKSKVGYEVPFNRHFYVFQPPRPLSTLNQELKSVTDKILKMIGGLSA